MKSYGAIAFLSTNLGNPGTTAKQAAMVRACVSKKIDWMKKCMEHEMKGSRQRGRPKRTWREVVQKDWQAHKLNRKDAMDHSRWKLIKIG